ncbi:Peroxisomal targeting signal 2 receptor [Zancudomyces culisetae]|uniref:Peroxin-7 n=1 Tax=Zancudomyces culisetae TaxID=1213189 RepID=A0A1R1PW12_ZANCU|nr:Peroxisomal targeting signal 2 receptor [Zancudomyces culisetae]|eukprot:OMH85156.1 Peroxisomal targeting signal 2 receptor [Zancudomyces culisetae]
MTFLGHEQNSCVYDISFSSKNPNMFASCGGDKTIRFWDAALPPSSSNTLTLANSGHRDQILSIDHNKYQQTMIATASTDKTIMLWDLANPTRPIIQLGPFDFPVRKLEFSPFHKQLLAVCGYDMRVSIWDIDKMRIVYQSSDATEFVFGINWSLFQPGLLASHSWDESVTCYQL